MSFVAVIAVGAGVDGVDVYALMGDVMLVSSATMFARALASDVFTHLGLVGAQGPSAVLVEVVIEGAPLQVVVLWVLDAGIDLELEEV